MSALTGRRARKTTVHCTPGWTGAGFLVALSILAAGCSSGSSGSPGAQANALVAAGLRAQTHGDTQHALQDYLAASAKDPTNKFAYYDAGVIYQQRNDASNASTAYHKALLADPHYRPALFNLAILLTPTEPAQAISVYGQLLTLNGNDPNVLFNLGLLLIQQNQPAQGHADLQKAIALQPSLRTRVPAGISP